jgi:hypothetical protein
MDRHKGHLEGPLISCFCRFFVVITFPCTRVQQKVLTFDKPSRFHMYFHMDLGSWESFLSCNWYPSLTVYEPIVGPHPLLSLIERLKGETPCKLRVNNKWTFFERCAGGESCFQPCHKPKTSRSQTNRSNKV